MPAREEDTLAIVRLLKVSLGETLLPKSTDYWSWKHSENPFGKSPVLVCWDGDEIVGVRAFMRWNWRQRDTIFRSVRAVDTATHPSYQGKGIFKKLTLQLVEECTNDDVQFVFNTPNAQSKPGYLKMGWSEAGRLPITVGLSGFLPFLRKIDERCCELNYVLDHPGLSDLIAFHSERADTVVTDLSLAYLKWRYRDVPLVKYHAISVERNMALAGVLFVRLKQGKLGVELRITDCFVLDSEARKLLMSRLKEFERGVKSMLTTQSGLASVNFQELRRIVDFKTARGPVVTIRGLARVDLNFLNNFKEWSPSLGDLELF